MLKEFITSKYMGLLLSIIGYILAVACVIIFLNVDSTPERIIWVLLWLTCCGGSDYLFKKYK